MADQPSPGPLMLQLALPWLSATLLLALRLAPLLLAAPVLGAAAFPLRARVMLGLALALLLVAVQPVSPTAPAVPLALGPWLAAALGELVVGAALAFGLMTVFGAFSLAGRLLDIQIGFGVASLFDPSTRAAAPLLGTALNLLAVTVFFALDGHHAIVRALAQSLADWPPGSGLARLDGTVLLAQFGAMFSHGLMIVAPAVLGLLLLDIGMAVVARTMPQMNIFVVSMPLKVAVGLALLVAGLGVMAPLMRQLFAGLPLAWQAMLR